MILNAWECPASRKGFAMAGLGSRCAQPRKPVRLAPMGRPLLMGVINVTPDSFSDGGEAITPAAALRRARALVEAGADWLDVGAESSRPGAEPVSVAEECRRLLPVLRRLRDLPVPISVDTYKTEVAEAALDHGASIINDITALADPAMRRLAARRRATVILMHMQGTPASMQAAPRYRDVVREVRRDLLKAARQAQTAGIHASKIILDPGLGFGKTLAHNLALVRHLDRLVGAGYPVLVGPSRKSFITGVLGPLPPKARIWGTAAVIALAVNQGARLFRVHDVAEMRMVADMACAVRGKSCSSGRSA